MRTVEDRFPDALGSVTHREGRTGGDPIIPRSRVGYLSEIAETIRAYDDDAERSAVAAGNLQAVIRAGALAPQASLGELVHQLRADVPMSLLSSLETWEDEVDAHAGGDIAYEVRGREIVVDNEIETMSGTTFPKVIHPQFDGWADRVRWLAQENLPGRFPYAAGVFPFKREQEDPTRMFAGEGSPEQTNRRFHYLAKGMPAVR